jgi:hypothetical protein
VPLLLVEVEVGAEEELHEEVGVEEVEVEEPLQQQQQEEELERQDILQVQCIKLMNLMRPLMISKMNMLLLSPLLVVQHIMILTTVTIKLIRHTVTPLEAMGMMRIPMIHQLLLLPLLVLGMILLHITTLHSTSSSSLALIQKTTIPWKQVEGLSLIINTRPLPQLHVVHVVVGDTPHLLINTRS